MSAFIQPASETSLIAAYLRPVPRSVDSKPVRARNVAANLPKTSELQANARISVRNRRFPALQTRRVGRAHRRLWVDRAWPDRATPRCRDAPTEFRRGRSV